MDIAVVILNWNCKKYMEKFLPTLIERTTQSGAFIVVADNGSTDGSAEWLAANYPQIQQIRFDRNWGFTGGYNRALAQIDADYYVLLNDDIEVSEGWLEPLAEFMEENPDVGICQPKIRSYAEPEKFEYAGAAGGFIDRYGYPFCRGRILGNLEKDNGQYDEPMEVFWATGACMMIRSALYHHLGGLDESFFAHMEEIDLCWRAKLTGYQVWAVPQSVVYHVGGGSLPNNSPRKLYFNFRNNLLMLRKNLPVSTRKRIMFIRMALDLMSAAVYLVTGRWSSFKAVLEAHRDYRHMKKDVEPSPFSEQRNDNGLLEGSVVLKYYLSRGKLTFDELSL
ncbi:MAG: glycosyltransferase family 2 protein [Bacteroidales bacterium]|nr:glycosyltransferase family 2 protein [Bacteroidales bacterium]